MKIKKTELINVFAWKITPSSILFECPQCWSHYKQNGERTLLSKRLIHQHGNELFTAENRVVIRTPHCVVDNNILNFNITIDDNTIREGF